MNEKKYLVIIEVENSKNEFDVIANVYSERELYECYNGFYVYNWREDNWHKVENKKEAYEILMQDIEHCSVKEFIEKKGEREFVEKFVESEYFFKNTYYGINPNRNIRIYELSKKGAILINTECL